MTEGFRGGRSPYRTWVARTAAIVAAATLLWSLGALAGQTPSRPPGVPEAASSAPPPAPASSAAHDDFQKRLAAYLKLRGDLARKLKPLSPTADAAELAVRQEALAAALKSARRSARPGDVIPAEVAREIRAVVRADLSSRTSDARHAALEEVPRGVTLAINRTFPAKAALATVPPLLLDKLPRLPDNLQYRFANRHVLLLDGDTEIIVDYVSDVLPPR